MILIIICFLLVVLGFYSFFKNLFGSVGVIGKAINTPQYEKDYEKSMKELELKEAQIKFKKLSRIKELDVTDYKNYVNNYRQIIQDYKKEIDEIEPARKQLREQKEKEYYKNVIKKG